MKLRELLEKGIGTNEPFYLDPKGLDYNIRKGLQVLAPFVDQETEVVTGTEFPAGWIRALTTESKETIKVDMSQCLPSLDWTVFHVSPVAATVKS